MDDPFLEKLRALEADAQRRSHALAVRRAKLIAAEVRRTKSVANVAKRMGVSTQAVRKNLDKIGAPPPSRPWMREQYRARLAEEARQTERAASTSESASSAE